MRNARRYIVTGRVQGVGFRAATERSARELGLAGWVRNRRDGGVELVAAGDDAALDRLGDWLAAGPTMARVDHVEVAPTDSDDDLPQPFAVR